MPATTTFASLLSSLAEETGLGLVIEAGTGSTTTITETDTGVSELRGPFTGLKIAVGRPVTVITGGTVGEDTFVSNFSPSTGVVTLSPAITTGATGFIIWEQEIEHGKYVEKAVQRALNNRMGRWRLTPLTFVPDGDLQGATVTDYWTAGANGTAAYATAQIFPAGSAADAVGQVGTDRVVQITSSGGSTTLDSNGIRVAANTQVTGYQWYFFTAIRLVSGSGTATLSVRDNTAGTAITTNVIRGSSTATFATSDLGAFMICEGTFNLPTNCAEIGFRLSLSATGLVAQMAQLVAFPMQATSFPIPNRIESDDFIGNFVYGSALNSPSAMFNMSFSEPITTDGFTHKLYNFGDHRTVVFNFFPTRSVWFEEFAPADSLAAMADTTTFPADQVRKWAKLELYDWLMRREAQKKLRADNGVPLPSIYRPLRNAAAKSAMSSSYEPLLKTVYGRVN